MIDNEQLVSPHSQDVCACDNYSRYTPLCWLYAKGALILLIWNSHFCIIYSYCSVTSKLDSYAIWHWLMNTACLHIILLIDLFVSGCLTSQQQSVSQGRLCIDSFTCRHRETGWKFKAVHFVTVYSPSPPPYSPSYNGRAAGSSHLSTNFQISNVLRLGTAGSDPWSFAIILRLTIWLSRQYVLLVQMCTHICCWCELTQFWIICLALDCKCNVCGFSVVRMLCQNDTLWLFWTRLLYQYGRNMSV